MKRRETDPASNQFPKCFPLSGTHRDSQSWVEKRRGREETEVARRMKGGNQKERQIQPVISSLSVLHHLEHTKRFTELGREEKGGGDRGDLVEKKENPKERAVKPVILLFQVKMGTEDWVFEGKKLITNTKKQRLKI